MSRLRRCLARLAALCGARRLDLDFNDEIASHLAEAIDDYRARGFSPDEARRAALRDFGGVEQTKESHRHERSASWLRDLGRDLQYGARILRRNPLFTFTAGASLAIGIGATTTIALLADALFLQSPAGIERSDRLIDIGSTLGRGGFGPVSYADFLNVRERASTLASVYAYSAPHTASVSLRGDDSDGSPSTGVVVTANYFTSLGTVPIAGRVFTANHDGVQPDPNAVAVVSERWWNVRLGRDPAIIGQSLMINGHPFTVVGIVPASFQGTGIQRVDVWMPVGTAAAAALHANTFTWLVGGRLRDDVSFAQAASEIAVFGSGRTATPRSDQRPTLRALPMSLLPGDHAPVIALLSFLMLIMILVLVVASTNVAGVLLARASARHQEMAVRLSMGAGRGRLVRQLLTETLLLFALSGVAGLILASVGAEMAATYLAASSVAIDLNPATDVRIVIFAAIVSLGVGSSAGLAPARHASRMNITPGLSATMFAPRQSRTRYVFLIAETALSTFLVVIAGLCIQALRSGNIAGAMYDSNAVQLTAVDLSREGYTTPTGSRFIKDALARLHTVPDVIEASAAAFTPGGFESMRQRVSVERADGQTSFGVDWNAVEPGYFSTLKVARIAGRDFNERDFDGALPVAIISREAAAQFWPAQPPENAPGNRLDQAIYRDRQIAGTRTLLVVGVVQDIKATSLFDGIARPTVYVPLEQAYVPQVTFLVRARGGAARANSTREILAALDPNMIPTSSQTLADALAYGLLPQRVLASIAGSLGVVTILLVGIGVYGVTAYMVTRRTREIGIRVALGAPRGRIIRMVLADGTWPILIGLVPGLALAAGAARVLAAYLFGTPPMDPLVVSTTAALFVVLSLIACFAPAWRAIRINATEALRYE